MTLDDVAGRSAYDGDHEAFRQSVRQFLRKEGVPNVAEWEANRLVPPAFWRAAGAVGMLCPTVPEAYGGLGLDFGYNTIVNEELTYNGVPAGFTLQSDIVVGYLEHYNGSKTYITNGQNADLVLVVAKTDPAAQPAYKGMSIILVEANRDGFRRGRKLDKIGQEAADTSELFFDDVRVPITHCLGEEGKGFVYLMSQLPQERLSIAIGAQASSQKAFDETVAFTKDRKAFAGVVFDFQNTRFVLAGLATKLQVGWAHLDWAIRRHLDGKLTNEEGAAAKLWHTELQWEVMDACLQLHGGAGYMNEYPIARAWRAARVSRIYGGTSEIMKEVIGRKL